MLFGYFQGVVVRKLFTWEPPWPQGEKGFHNHIVGVAVLNNLVPLEVHQRLYVIHAMGTILVVSLFSRLGH